MNFTLNAIGTASAMPVIERISSAQALSVCGRSFLLDCGEGTQRGLRKAGISLQQIEAIFITHVHGDHIFGLPGLISSMSMLGRKSPLRVYGPAALASFISFFSEFCGESLGYELEFCPVSAEEPEIIYENKNSEVLAFPLNHGIETYGYIIREKPAALNLRPEALRRHAFSIEEMGLLKKGCDITREGAIIRSADVTFRRRLPRSYAYVTDTAPFPALAGWLSGVDVLYHETTYTADLAEQAVKHHHSTTVDAAQCALEAGVGLLLIGHYSSRCRSKKVYEEECRRIFPGTRALDDGDVVEFPDKEAPENQ